MDLSGKIAAGNDQPLDEVFQLPDIAGPVIMLQRLVGGGGEGLGFPISLEGAGKKVLAQRNDISCALPQRRNGQRHDVQTVIEVHPEGAVLDAGGQVGIRGGDDTEVDVFPLQRADPLHLLGLQYAEQLALERQGHRVYLVQKKGPAVGDLDEAPLAGGVCTGKGPLLIAKELGFQQMLRQGSTVHDHHVALPAGAVVVDEIGQDLLAGTGFTRDQNGNIRGGDHFCGVEQPLHLPAAINDLRLILFGGAHIVGDVGLLLGGAVLGVKIVEIHKGADDIGNISEFIKDGNGGDQFVIAAVVTAVIGVLDGSGRPLGLYRFVEQADVAHLGAIDVVGVEVLEVLVRVIAEFEMGRVDKLNPAILVVDHNADIYIVQQALVKRERQLEAPPFQNCGE